MVAPENKSEDVCLELTCFVNVSSGDLFCRYERRSATHVYKSLQLTVDIRNMKLSRSLNETK